MKDRWSSKERRASLHQSSIRPPLSAQEKNAELQQLATKFPHATKEERIRFLKACNGDLDFASKELQYYLDWRLDNHLDNNNDATTEDQKQEESHDDHHDWSSACTHALAVMSQDPEDARKSLRKHRLQNPTSLPQIARMYYDEHSNPLTARDGTIVVQFLPARLDKTRASNECYALALAFYLDQKFDRSSLDCGTLLIDVRRGQDWPNPSAQHLLAFVKEVARMLPKLYPERLSSCLVYPVPRMANFLWSMVKPLLSEAIAGDVLLLNGSAAMDAPVPKKLSEHVDEAAMDRLEAGRHDACRGAD